jgi:hypothetical protein
MISLKPTDCEKFTLVFPDLPLVVIIITPAAPLEPYIEEEAPFKISMFAISSVNVGYSICCII